ncbi:MAG: hypothetical protein ACM3NH_04365 [Candidatus Saccharibacteria bacterium]
MILSLCLSAAIAAGCGGDGKSQEKGNALRYSPAHKPQENLKARNQAEMIAHVDAWRLDSFSQPDSSTVVLGISDPQSGRTLTVTAQMPHANWDRYLHLQGMEGATLKFQFLRQGYREDMQNTNNGDYLSPTVVSDAKENSTVGFSFFVLKSICQTAKKRL